MRRLLLIFVILACSSVAAAAVVEPHRPTIEFVPPAVYLMWWRAMERCTGLHGQMAAWTFLMTPATDLGPTELPGVVVIGETDWVKHTITLTAPTLLAASDVKHEMIHALGVRGHPYDVFVTRCKVESDKSIRVQSNPTGLPKKPIP